MNAVSLARDNRGLLSSLAKAREFSQAGLGRRGANIGSVMSPVPSSILAVLFADIYSSVRLYELKGDAEAQRLTAWSIKTMCDITRVFGGRLVGTRGDGVMSTFVTANAAYGAGLEMQRAHRGTPTPIKVGIAIGPVIEENGEAR